VFEQCKEDIANFSKAIKNNPSDSNNYLNRGIAYYDSRDFSKALADFDKVIELDRAYADAFYYSEHYSKALNDIWLNRTYADAFYHRSLVNNAREDFDAARRDGEQAFTLFRRQGNAHYAAGHDNEAIESYGKAIKVFPHPDRVGYGYPGIADIYYSRGLTYYKSRVYDKALADFNIAIHLGHADADTFYNRSLVEEALGHYDYARQDLAQAFSLFWQQSYTHRDAGRYREAIDNFSKAVEINPGNAVIYCERGILYCKLEEFDKAQADFDKAIKLNPTYAYAFYQRSLLKEALGDQDGAKKDREQAFPLQQTQSKPVIATIQQTQPQPITTTATIQQTQPVLPSKFQQAQTTTPNDVNSYMPPQNQFKHQLQGPGLPAVPRSGTSANTHQCYSTSFYPQASSNLPAQASHVFSNTTTTTTSTYEEETNFPYENKLSEVVKFEEKWVRTLDVIYGNKEKFIPILGDNMHKSLRVKTYAALKDASKSSQDKNIIFGSIGFLYEIITESTYHIEHIDIVKPGFDYIHVTTEYGDLGIAENKRKFLEDLKRYHPGKEETIEGIYRSGNPNFPQTFHHSERALYKFLENPETLKMFAGDFSTIVRGNHGDKEANVLGIILDFHSNHYLCNWCKEGLAYFQKNSFFPKGLALALQNESGIKVDNPYMDKDTSLYVVTRFSAEKHAKDQKTKETREHPLEEINIREHRNSSYALILERDNIIINGEYSDTGATSRHTDVRKKKRKSFANKGENNSQASSSSITTIVSSDQSNININSNHMQVSGATNSTNTSVSHFYKHFGLMNNNGASPYVTNPEVEDEAINLAIEISLQEQYG
jgi:tetratricopeptide (TPR) repeat protein